MSFLVLRSAAILVHLSKVVRVTGYVLDESRHFDKPGNRGGSRILGKGGSDKYIHNLGRHAPSRDRKWVGGNADSPTSGVWGKVPAAFLFCMCLFTMKFTVISNTHTSRDIRITRACMNGDEKTLHSSQCYRSYCSAIKFVTESFCEFVTEACT